MTEDKFLNKENHDVFTFGRPPVPSDPIAAESPHPVMSVARNGSGLAAESGKGEYEEQNISLPRNCSYRGIQLEVN